MNVKNDCRGPQEDTQEGSEESEIDILTNGDNAQRCYKEVPQKNGYDADGEDYCEQGPPTLALSDVIRLHTSHILLQRLKNLCAADDRYHNLCNLVHSEHMSEWLSKLTKKQRTVLQVAEGLDNVISAYFVATRKRKLAERDLTVFQRSELVKVIVSDYEGAVKCWEYILKQSNRY